MKFDDYSDSTLTFYWIWRLCIYEIDLCKLVVFDEQFDDYSDFPLIYFLGYGDSPSMRALCVSLLFPVEKFDYYSNSTPNIIYWIWGLPIYEIDLCKFVVFG